MKRQITRVQAVHGLIELQLLATIQFCGRRAVLLEQTLFVRVAALIVSMEAWR